MQLNHQDKTLQLTEIRYSEAGEQIRVLLRSVCLFYERRERKDKKTQRWSCNIRPVGSDSTVTFLIIKSVELGSDWGARCSQCHLVAAEGTLVFKMSPHLTRFKIFKTLKSIINKPKTRFQVLWGLYLILLDAPFCSYLGFGSRKCILVMLYSA